jgi:Arc/MetJ-type ribon-helix-helix transcriptional regulator
LSVLNITLSDQERRWLDERLRSGAFTDPSAYVEELIREDRERSCLLDALREGVDDVTSGNLRPVQQVLDRMERSARDS